MSKPHAHVAGFDGARRMIERLQPNGLLPEPLRVAHMIAGAGESRHRA